MISQPMTDALNKQIELEGYASFLYLAMASWCDKEGMEGCSQFLHRQSAEERGHMLRIFRYLAEVDAHAIVPAIPQPPREFESPQVVFQQVYAHEQKVTAAINDLIKLSKEENDHSTHVFLQWYVTEQREEEALMRSILDRIKLIGTGGQSLYFIDLELGKINAAAVAAEASGE